MKRILLLMASMACLLLAGCQGDAETVVESNPPVVTEPPAVSNVPEVVETAEPIVEGTYDDLVKKLEAIIADTKEKADAHEAKGANLMTQTDMNFHSSELYKIWDDAINEIWALLDDNLERELFYTIQAEQIAWITEKETEIQKIQEEYNGGSITALACNTKAAQMTEERIDELLEYIKQS